MIKRYETGQRVVCEIIFAERTNRHTNSVRNEYIPTGEDAPPKDWNPRCFGRSFAFPSKECDACLKKNECIEAWDRIGKVESDSTQSSESGECQK
jgi:hypothetical protein